MAVLQSLWEGWSGQNLSSPQQGQSIDNRTETRQLLNVILDYINSAENTNKRVRSKERIAGIKADLNRQQDLLDLQVKLAGVEGKANEAKLRSLTSLTEASLKSWTKYLTDTSQAYSRALMVFDNERRKFQGDPARAWGTVFGEIGKDATIAMDRTSPKFQTTFLEMNQKQPVIEMDAQNNVVFKNGRPVIIAAGLGNATQREIISAANDYQSVKNATGAALDRFNAIQPLIDEAANSLMGKTPGAAQKQFDAAILALKKADTEAEGAIGKLDAESLQAELNVLEQGDAVLQDIKSQVPDLLKQLSTEDGGWTRMVTTEKFQQWAADRGIVVGYKGDNGNYIPGPNDELAVARWANESSKNPGNYGLLANRFTDEIVQVVDGQGNIVAKGFRQPVHANDREGTVRIMTKGGQSQEFTKQQIGDGEVQVLMTYPGGVRRLGSPMRRLKMEDAFEYLEAYGDTTATRASEEVEPGQYATRKGIDGEEYLTKEQYDRARAQSDVEVGRMVIDQDEKKAYLRFGDSVFDFNFADGAISKVNDDAVVERVKGLPSSIAVKDDEALLYKDIVEGDGFVAKLGKIGRTTSDEETKTYLDSGRRKFLTDQGVALTTKPRELISGATKDVMGVTFRQAKLPQRPESREDATVKPGDDPLDDTPKESGAPPVSAVRNRKSDSELIRDMLNREKSDAGEPSAPANAAKAASFIRPELAKFKRDPDARLDDDPDDEFSQFEDRAESRAARKEAKRERLQGKVDEAMDVLRQRSVNSQVTGRFDPADTEAIKALKKKRRVQRKLDRMGTPDSPTPENAQGQTDLNTESEVSSASSGPTRVKVDSGMKDELDAARETRRKQAERDAAKRGEDDE